ncbi:MAG: acireductone synthase [Gammaproteobacteria bacterium]|jgi:enolase-phosphatase E1
MIKAIVTDIEGTTSSLSFVKDVLFPYARERIAGFVREHGHEPAVRGLLDDVRAEAGKPLSDAECAALLLRWIDEDKKITPLKVLQGIIWQSGYRQGDFTGHVYEDAVRNLRRWKEQGIALYVFSSGSVQAQRLIFGYSDHGDLTPLFSGYFDTTIGAKRDVEAYRKITAAITLEPAQILFLSDIKEELDAARAAGMHTVWLVREGTIATPAAHPQVRDFDAVQPLQYG